MADRSITVSLDFVANTNQAENALRNLQTSLQNISNMSTIGQDARMTKNIEEASAAAMKLRNNLQAAFDQKTGSLNLSKLNEEMAKSGMSAEKYRKTLSAIGPQGRQAFMELANAVVASETPLKQTTGLVDKLWDSLKRTAGWQLSSSMIHGFMGAVQSAYGYAQNLNQSLNNIRIVTGQSAEQMAQFAEQANKSAKALSSTTLDYTDAALIYYQQGIRDESEIAERTDATIKLANVSRQSAEEVSSQMTAIWNNFADGSHTLEYYADVITKLGATTASSSQEIAGGMEKFAAVAETVGLSYEYAASALATVVATTRQSEDTVGTGLRTIFSRLEGLKLGDTLEDGTDLNKYSEALKTVGVNIKDASGGLKDMDTILDETAAKWDTLDQAQKVAFATTVGGVRQYTNLIALLDNWDMMQENVTNALGSEGTLQEQQEIYAESWEAAGKRVRAAAEAIYSDLLKDDFFIDITKLFAGLLETIDKVIDAFGGLQGTLPLILTLVSKIFGSKIQAGAQRLAENIYFSTNAGQKAREEADMATKTAFIKETQRIASEGAGENEGKALASGYAQIANLQLEMLQNAKNLTDAEKQQYKMEIDRLEVLTKETAEMGRQADALNKITKKDRVNILAGAETPDGSEQAQSFQNSKDYYNVMYNPNIPSPSRELSGDRENNDARFFEQLMGLEEGAISNTTQLSEAFRLLNETLSGDFSNDLQVFEKLNSEIGQMDNLMDQLMQSEDGVAKIIDSNDIEQVEKAKDELRTLHKQVKELTGAKLDIITEDEINDIEKYQTTYQALEKHLANARIRKQKDSDSKANILQNAYGTSGLKDFGKEIQEATRVQTSFNNEMNKTPQAAKAADNAVQQTGANIEQTGNKATIAKQKISNVLGSLSNFGQVAMSISMVMGAFDGLRNAITAPDMSGWERMSSIMMSLGMLIPSIASTFNNLTKAITGYTTITALAKAVNEAYIASETKGLGTLLKIIASKILKTGATTAEAAAEGAAVPPTMAHGAANIFLEGTFVPLLIIVLAFVAALATLALITKGVIAIVKAISKSFHEEEMEAQRTKAAVAELSRAYQEASQAVTDFKSNLSNYDNAVAELGNLKQGTSEYIEKMQEANNAALELLNSVIGLKDASGNPIVLDVKTENGLITFTNPEQLESAETALRAQQNMAGLQMMLGKKQAAEADFRSSNHKIVEGALDETTTEGEVEGTVAGAGAGAAIGGAIGTAIAPGIGTAIGTGLGLLIGGIAGHEVEDDYEADISTDALDVLYKKYEESGYDDSMFSKANFDGVLQDIGIDDENLREALAAHADEIRANCQEIAANSAALKEATAAYIHGVLDGKSENYDKLNDASKDAVDHAVAERSEQALIEAQEKVDKMSSSEVENAIIENLEAQHPGEVYRIKDDTLQKQNADTGAWEDQGSAGSYDSDTQKQFLSQQYASQSMIDMGDEQAKRAGWAESSASHDTQGVLSEELIGDIESTILAFDTRSEAIADALEHPEKFADLGSLSKEEIAQLQADTKGTYLNDTKDDGQPGYLSAYVDSGQYDQDRAAYLQETRDNALNDLSSEYGVDNDRFEMTQAANNGDIDMLKYLQEEYGLTKQAAEEYLETRRQIETNDDIDADRHQKSLMEEASAYTSLTDEVKDLDKAIARYGKDSEEAAKAQDKLDKSLKSIKWSKFAKDAGKYIDTINEGTDPEEMEKAYQGLADGLNEIFDTTVTKEWVNEHMDAINKLQQAAMSGNEEATQQAAMELEMLANMSNADLQISADGSAALEAMTGVSNAYDALQAYVQSGKITITADGRADFSQLINELIAAGAKGEDVAAILNALGQTNVDFSGFASGVPVPAGTYDVSTPEGQAALAEWLNDLGNTKVDLNVVGGAVPDFSPAAMKNLGGSGGKGGGGGGGGGSKKTKDAPEEDRSSRYHSVNQNIKNLERKQDTTDRRKDRAFGKAEVELQKESIQLQKERIQLQQEYVRQISETLEKDRADMLQKFSELQLPINLDFDEASGEISNYEDVIDALFEKEKALVEQYNSGGLDDEAFDEAKKKLDEAKEALGNYEETLELQKDELQTLAEYMEELSDKALELTQIKFELNMSIIEDQLEWLDYSLSKIEDDAYSAAKAIALMGEQTSQYLKQGDIARAAISEILGRHGVNSIEELNGLSDSQIEALGFNKNEIDALKEYRSQLYESNQALLEMRRTITDKVLDTFDVFNEKVQESYEEFDKYNDILESYNNIVDLLGTKTDAATRRLVKNIRDTQLQNLRNQSVSAKEIYEGALANYNLAEKQYNDAVARYGVNSIEAQQMEEIMKQAADARDEAYSSWLDAYQASLEKAREIYEAEMEELQKDFERSLTGIYGTFDLFDAAYERAKELKDNYIPEYEKIYELNKLNRDIQKEIDNSSSLRDKKALRQLQDEINRKQEAGVQLSKYEVEEMRKKFELEQARMNLEDARNSKSEVRLTRDQNGNWGYVYTASEDKVAEAEQKYEDALYQYQKLSDDYITDLDEKIKDLTKNTQERLDEVREALEEGLIDIDQAEQQKQDILNNFYMQQSYLVSQFKGATDSLASSLGLMDELYGQQAELVDTLPETTFGQLSQTGSMEEWAAKSSEEILKYAEESAKAYERLQTTNQEIADQNKLNLSDIETATNNVAKSSEETQKKVSETVQALADSFKSTMGALATWDQTYATTIQNAIGQNELFITSLNNVIAKLGLIATYEMKDLYEYIDYLSAKGAKGETITEEEWKKLDEIRQKYAVNYSKESMAPFDTGGYTGEWGDEGKIAILHEKEYVLNADLTARFFDALKTFSLVDQFVNAENQIQQQKLQIQTLETLSNYIDQLADRMNTTTINPNDFSTSLFNSSNQQLEQNVHIEASFPNVTQSSEIEMAFDNLVNKASQYANRKDMSSMTFGDAYISKF